MSKQLCIATVFSGLFLITAPMVGIAETTLQSTITAQATEEATGFWAKGVALVKGAGSQAGDVWTSIRDVDERLIRKDEQLSAKDELIALANQEIVQLRAAATQRKFVNGLSLAETKACISTISEFLTLQVEGK